jgi:hypothetical protein
MINGWQSLAANGGARFLTASGGPSETRLERTLATLCQNGERQRPDQSETCVKIPSLPLRILTLAGRIKVDVMR